MLKLISIYRSLSIGQTNKKLTKIVKTIWISQKQKKLSALNFPKFQIHKFRVSTMIPLQKAKIFYYRKSNALKQLSTFGTHVPQIYGNHFSWWNFSMNIRCRPMILKLLNCVTILKQILFFVPGVCSMSPLFCLILQSKFTKFVTFHDLYAFCVDIKNDENIFHKICCLVLHVSAPWLASSHGTHQTKIEVRFEICSEISLGQKSGDFVRNFLTHNRKFLPQQLKTNLFLLCFGCTQNSNFELFCVSFFRQLWVSNNIVNSCSWSEILPKCAASGKYSKYRFEPGDFSM